MIASQLVNNTRLTFFFGFDAIRYRDAASSGKRFTYELGSINFTQLHKIYLFPLS